MQITNWKRHLGFRTTEALLQELVSTAPHSVYHSAALYKIPVARHMDEKNWLGADLVFDIDADHLDSPCLHEHDLWVCSNPGCGASGYGPPPESGCPRCGSLQLSARKWICDRCLQDAKRHTARLFDEVLTGDLGLDPSEITLNYSGHRGYHVRVSSAPLMKMDSSARVELIHYITGMGFSSSRFVAVQGSSVTIPPRDVPGWAGKIADSMLELLRDLDYYSGDERWVRPLKAGRQAAAEGLMRNPPVLSRRVKGVGPKSWQEIAVRSAMAYGVGIDVPVTHDVHRVIRLVGSLNGKTGLVVAALSRDELDDFDPFSDAVAFDTGHLRLRFPESAPVVPRVRIGQDICGPFWNETVDLPMPVASFLLCKGVAVLA